MRTGWAITVAVALGAALAMVAAAAAGGSPAACVPSCDCEAIGAGPIAQPANAWTAVAFVVAGAWAARRRGSRQAGVLITLIGVAAFAAHATTAGWAYRAEGAVLAAAAWAMAAGDRGRAAAAFLGAGVAAWLVPDPGAMVVAVAGAVAFLAFGAARRITSKFGIPAAALLMAGLALRLLADDGGPWCRPDAVVPGHAVWHLVAAGGLLLVAGGLAAPAPDSPDRVLPFGPGRRPTEPPDDPAR